MAHIHEQNGDFKEAERWYLSLTEGWDFPYVAAAYKGLARVYSAMDRDEDAQDYIDRAGRRLGLGEDGVDRLREAVRRALQASGRPPNAAAENGANPESSR